MSFRTIVLISFVFYLGVEGKFYDKNLTDFSTCKVHYTRTGIQYKDFFEIADDARDSGTILDFHFSVLAASDAHILLSPSSQLHPNDPVYEIVLGAGGNTFCAIRRLQKAAAKASIRIRGLLSAVDVRSFWLHISVDGLIEVGRETEELAFISWNDPDLLPIKVFSFSTWVGIEAKWYYDCVRNNITTDSKEVEPVLDDLQRLKKDILIDYNPLVRPVAYEADSTLVSLEIRLNHISMDVRKGVLEVKGDIEMQWIDEKLTWSPEDYGGIENINMPFYRVWNPKLQLDSYASANSMYVKTVYVNNFGIVTYASYIDVQSWCDPNDLEIWPADNHTCTLKFTFPYDSTGVQLNYSANKSSFLNKYASQWDVLDVKEVANYGLLSDYEPDPAYLKISLTIKRKQSTYKYIYSTPFLVIALAMLTTFWVSPLGYLKIVLACIELILATVILLHLDTQLPGHPTKVPNIVLIYSSSLIGTIGSVLISILVINMSRKEHRYGVPSIISNILMSPVAQNILLLPNVKNATEYGKLNDTPALRKHDAVQGMWILLATFIDRLSFILYLILITAVLFFKY